MPEENKNQLPRTNRNKVRLLSGLSFLLGFFDAFLVYALSSYFARISGESMVGGFYLVAFGLVFWLLMRLQPIVHSLGSVRLLGILLVGLIGTSFFLSLGEPSWIGAGILLGYIICSNLVWSVMDILVEDFSTDQVSGRVRGFYLTILNLGILLAPMISTQILSFLGYQGIFSVVSMGYILVLLLALAGLRHHQTVQLPKVVFADTIWKVMKRKNIMLIYGVSWVLEFFYSIMVVYMPMLLISQGFDWGGIGFIFTVMLIPFVLVQYPVGIIADRKWGEKELLLVALVILGLSSVAVGFTRSTDIIFWAGLLFVTRLGAATLEVLRDSYFYKQIGPNDVEMIAFFRSARPTAAIAAAGISLFFLAIFTLHSLFYLVGALALAACFAVFSIEDTKSEKERGLLRAQGQ